MNPERCAWCGTDSLYLSYHDAEWGVPDHDDRRLFEKLVLDLSLIHISEPTRPY